MGNIGSTELVIIFILALLLLGPKRLPEVGESLGKMLRRFRQASRELRDELDVRRDLDVRGDLDIRRELRAADKSPPQVAPAREAQARTAPAEKTRAPENPPAVAGAGAPDDTRTTAPETDGPAPDPAEPGRDAEAERG